MQSKQSAKPTQRRTRLLALIGLAGVAEFVVAVLALHATSLSAQPWHMSEFANGRYWLLWAVALFGFAIGGAALTFALRPRLAASGSQRAGLIMLWLAGIGALTMGAFPVDRDADNATLPGIIHEDVGPPTFVLSGAAMLVLVPAFRGSTRFRSFAGPSLAIGVLVTASAVTYVICTQHQLAFAAIAQRVLVGSIATWFILLGARLLRTPVPDAEPLVAAVVAQPALVPKRARRAALRPLVAARPRVPASRARKATS